MNLITVYNKSGVEGYPINTLQSILQGNDSVKVSKTMSGIIMLDNNTFIKCVDCYYFNPSATSQEKQRKMSNMCYAYQKKLGIFNVYNYNCVECHKKCIELLREKKLILK